MSLRTTLMLRDVIMSDIKIIPNFTENTIMDIFNTCLSNEDIIQTITELFKQEPKAYTVIDPKMFTYDEIPSIFINLSSWIKSTNLLCWYCRRNIKSTPWFEPQSVDPVQTNSTGNDHETTTDDCTFSTRGIFCSCSCVVAHILMISELTEKQNKMSMLTLLYSKMTGKKMKTMKPSPPSTLLECYGGNMTELEYDMMISSINQ